MLFPSRALNFCSIALQGFFAVSSLRSPFLRFLHGDLAQRSRWTGGGPGRDALFDQKRFGAHRAVIAGISELSIPILHKRDWLGQVRGERVVTKRRGGEDDVRARRTRPTGSRAPSSHGCGTAPVAPPSPPSPPCDPPGKATKARNLDPVNHGS